MRPWSSPPRLGAGAHPTGRGGPSGSRPIPPPRLRRASSRRDPPYPRPVEPAKEMVGSKCQPGTPAASLCPADPPSQHRAMPSGPASRANVSGFCFLMEPVSGTERHENGLQSPLCSPPSLPSPPLAVSLSLSVSVALSIALTFVG